MDIIARIRTDFPTKFGIPRQSGLASKLRGIIEFEPKYRNPDALRGLEQFSHIWLIWGFINPEKVGWSATVRPPRLGGNTRLGVFATRSPFRPNPIGLSCVELLGVEQRSESGEVLLVGGADLMDMTPIYDIKPYIRYTDSRPEASGGFAQDMLGYVLNVDFPEALLSLIPANKREALMQVLSQDPRPAYQSDPDRVYGFEFAGYDVRFTVSRDTLTVRGIVDMSDIQSLH